MSQIFQRFGLYFAWIVSMVATFGSLYFSEVAGFVPCTLCWYQRIFMYPFVILLGIASYRSDVRIIPYALPLSIIGGSISLYHYLIQKVPALAVLEPCRVGVPCSKDYIDWFGFITIPFLALVAFILITLFLWLCFKANRSVNKAK
ncbi:disulfide oxidoreductase [Thermoflavimicrobium dichotomicum]|uniref:Disulfide bond formation protein DsbB n=1 Tax=Thermoflavimicrobium dichotomicum TaxID=46223 RepID=A0A1I3L875_9BACL|nr:disulfide oxidoreductase [Thermoflavimicrobium dichotomicum]SFI80859.1 disulfide bond formation protein DsbB [Thermoflavimicrobium dichotomicum]